MLTVHACNASTPVLDCLPVATEALPLQELNSSLVATSVRPHLSLRFCFFHSWNSTTQEKPNSLQIRVFTPVLGDPCGKGEALN